MITKEQLLPFVALRSTLAHIGKSIGRSESAVFQALRRHKLHIPRNVRKPADVPLCKRCGCSEPSRFHKRKGLTQHGKPKGGWNSWCDSCLYENVRRHKRKNRQQIVSALGSRCVLCGFSKYLSALDAHHLVPGMKDPRSDHMGGWSLSRIEKELRGCVLLCANCHRGHHNGELSTEDENKLVMICNGLASSMPTRP